MMTDSSLHGELKSKKILLVLLPFWTPTTPPLGIASLKTFIQKYGYSVKAVDANVEKSLREFYFRYFNILKQYVPEEKWGNFYSIGHDVLQNHMLAFLNSSCEARYLELLKTLVSQTYYWNLNNRQAIELDNVLREFYSALKKYILDLLGREKPAVLGLSVYGGTLPASLFVFKLAREKYPHLETVMGGGIFHDQFAFGSTNFNTLLAETEAYIDKIIVGEGELLFLKYLRDELPESQRVYTLRDIKGQYFDIGSEDVADFSDFNIKSYSRLTAYTSRSCPYQCSFCSDTVWWGKYRKKTVRKVVEEFKALYERYGYQLFMLCDLLLNPVISELATELIHSDITVYWDGGLRADEEACRPENAVLWRQGGFYRARIGCESGSQRVLDIMQKKITVEHIKKAISNLASCGIETTTNWLIGHPGETEEDFRQTLDLIYELRDDIYEAECRPFYYYLTGQVHSNHWLEKYNHKPLYPPFADRMLVFQTWVLECSPSREETYDRVRRFVEHCNELGLVNAYSMKDIYEAEHRWQRLHKNAVPSLMDLNNEDMYIDECKLMKKLTLVQNTWEDSEDFRF